MKTGIELIAERQSKLLVSGGRLGDIGRMILSAEMPVEFSSITSKTDEAIKKVEINRRRYILRQVAKLKRKRR
jgi:hypothetical protein|nr:MAG TPA: hypothetical protein [Caudoviricetes sp.]